MSTSPVISSHAGTGGSSGPANSSPTTAPQPTAIRATATGVRIFLAVEEDTGQPTAARLKATSHAGFGFGAFMATG